MEKHSALIYVIENNPVCDNCARGNLDDIRASAGLYQLLKDIISSKKESYNHEELETMVKHATSF